MEGTPVAGEPRVVEMKSRKMLVAKTEGDPNDVAGVAVTSLYATLHQFVGENASLALEPIRARWPKGHDGPREGWIGIWAIPAPENTAGFVPVPTPVPVSVEEWEYGTVAEIAHAGDFEEEADSVATLKRFIEAGGYEVVGDQEEEYISLPGQGNQQTIIRFRVRRKE